MTQLPSLRGFAASFSTTVFGAAFATTAAFLALAALLFAMLFHQANAILADEVLAGLTREFAVLADVERAEGPLGLQQAIETRVRAPGPTLYLLADREGRRVVGNLSQVPPELTAEQPIFRYETGTGTGPRLAAGRLGQVSNGSILIVGRDIHEQRALAERLRLFALLGFGVVAVGGIGTGLLISRTVLRRVDSMTDASRAIMAGDLTQRLPRTGSEDELDRLAASLNDMLSRIELLMAGLKEVSDNIAHDLKTPLNRLRNRAEAALREASGPADLRTALEQTIESADDIIKTFNALLLIARLEAGAVEDTKRPVDLAEVVADLIELYEPVAEEAGLVLTTQLVPCPPVAANRQLIGQAVANLIENAIKYGCGKKACHRQQGNGTDNGHGADITVAVQSDGSAVSIEVADRGPGIAPEDRARALARFGRLEKSRSAPGTGLGLSLVAAVARLHGGELLLEDNAPGLRVVLRFPAASIARVTDAMVPV